MGRNKTIKLLHETTLKPYSECRAALKRNHWDFATAYCSMLGGFDFDEIAAEMNDFVNVLIKAIADACETLARCFNNAADALNRNAKTCSEYIAEVTNEELAEMLRNEVRENLIDEFGG